MSKPNSVPASTQAKSSSTAMFAVGAIIVALIVAILVFMFIMGSPGNFDNGDVAKGHPKNMLGIIHSGGPIVPVLMTMFLCVIIFTIERAMAVITASGKGNSADFTRKVQSSLASNNVDAAIAECDRQKGSVANVIRAGLVKYKEMGHNTELAKDQKIVAIQQELEESSALEMPMLERNLPILSTIGTVATLIALLGTVLGMIKAFNGMGQAGAADATALSIGISEALVNTALGIGTSALAIISYNFFTTKIDKMSYSIDEAGFTIGQTFNTHNK
jgi:biopolymer transport protein ExbB